MKTMKPIPTALFAAAIGMCFSGSLTAQNLVPNSSFEQLDESCIVGAQYSILSDWVQVDCASQPLFLHPCDIVYSDGQDAAPNNTLGSQVAFEGSAYLGMLAYTYGGSLASRSYAAVMLSGPLTAGTEYCLSMRASLAGRSAFRTETLSAVFTQDYPETCANQDFLDWDANAPVVFDVSDVDTTNWMLLSGSFTALGSEQYLVIGNFNADATMDSVFLGWTSAHIQCALYYLDAVVLQDCTIGFGEESQSTLRLWPNPTTDFVRFDSGPWRNGPAEYTVVDATGRTVASGVAQSDRIDVSALPTGSYSVGLRSSGAAWHARLVVQR